MKIRTEKQKTASRLNGRKSQGPITRMGKDRVRLNSLTHGLTAKLIFDTTNAEVI